ncbi:MAG: micrococcal nuclease [Natronomonas sp.]
MRAYITAGLLALVTALLLSGCTWLPAASEPDGTAPAVDHEVTVVEVVDADTLDVRMPDGGTETVRLLGVDAPETSAENDPAEFEGIPDTLVGRACLRTAGENATAAAEELLAGGTVRVRTDPTADRRGSYGRLLADVTVDNESLSRVLLARGHARLYDTTFQRRDEFATVENQAQAAGRGLWACR